MKEQTKDTDETIAAQVFPDRYKKKEGSTTRKVTEMVHQYKELTAGGGWRNITFP